MAHRRRAFVIYLVLKNFSFTIMPALHIPAVVCRNSGAAVRGGGPTLFPPATDILP